jgi:PAS domain S-box-containing protein
MPSSTGWRRGWSLRQRADSPPVDLAAVLAVLDSLPDCIWAADGERIFTYLSAGSERLIGYRPEELIGRSSEIVMHESSREAFEDGYRWQIAHPDGDQTYRVNLRHKDGQPVPVELHNIGTPINGRYAGGIGSVREISERLRLERELQEQAAELAASRERAHLAQELHDSVTQALFSMTITVGAARMLLEQNKPGVEAKLDELSSLAHEALVEMRSLIFELRPANLAEEGLVAALRKHVGSVEGRTGLMIRLEVSPDLPRLPLPIEEALYRIAQEAIHNVVKHAHARQVSITIANLSTVVRMEIGDDGLGFDPRTRSDGLGLPGMAARAERLGGSVSLRSTTGRGTVVVVVLPAASTHKADERRRSVLPSSARGK